MPQLILRAVGVDKFAEDSEAHEGGVDIVLTDPPYGRQWLSLYNQLARYADAVLKPDGLLVVMSGQAHLLEVMNRANEQNNLNYLWQMVYLFGGRPDQRSLPVGPMQPWRPAWKPLTVYGRRKGPCPYMANASDVIYAPPPDSEQVRPWHPEGWAQQQSAVTAILAHIAKGKDNLLIADPFLGTGTTAVAALQLKHRFTGCDVIPSVVTKAKGYIALAMGDHPNDDAATQHAAP